MEYQQHEEDQDDGFSIMQQKQQEISSFIYQLDTDTLIENLEHNLRGEKYNREKDTWEKRYAPRMNEVGINDIISLCYGVVQKNTILSELTEEEINTLMRTFHEELGVIIPSNVERYEINITQRRLILYQIISFIFAGLNRAKNGMTLEALTKIQQIVERIDTKKQQEQGRRFGFGIFGRGDK